ncbi:hypothetical protein V1508DRAFT_396471 [Lipomyces doorenjongii]|uniref:uncharacterized protein n=1 Tax=Lipomyces doorenjongii TaxID=383834 RepID=UPI0034CF63AC
MLAEEPIVLPQLGASERILVPPQPEEPPPIRIWLPLGHILLVCALGGLSDDQRPSQQELADAVRYSDDVKERVRVTRGGTLQQVLGQLRELRGDLRRDVQLINGRLDRLEEGQTDISRRLDNVTRTQNLPLIGPRRDGNRAADGDQIPFVLVPFNNGSMPTEYPHNLPPLYRLMDIESLNAEHLRAYCTGYGANMGNAAQMKARIRRAIGKLEQKT